MITVLKSFGVGLLIVASFFAGIFFGEFLIRFFENSDDVHPVIRFIVYVFIGLMSCAALTFIGFLIIRH